MPPRWPRKPDRKDPDFRRLDDRMTFATHVALFAASNSGLWFVRTLQQQNWVWAIWFSGLWLSALMAHGLYIFAIAKYNDSPYQPIANFDQNQQKDTSRSSTLDP